VRQRPTGGSEALEGQQRERGARGTPGGRIDRSIVLPGPRQTAIASFHVAKQHQLAWISYRQLAEEDVVDEAEDGGVGTDAEREREHDGHGEAGRLQEPADGESEVGNGHERLDVC
jgi:hypothetical protein